MVRKKIIVLLIVLFQLGIITGAKEISSKEGVDVLATKENTQNSTEFRTNTISADITGHTLTITFNDNVGIAHIVIKDSNGVYIDRENVLSTPVLNEGENIINAEDLKAGVYIWKTSSNNIVNSGKFIKK